MARTPLRGNTVFAPYAAETEAFKAEMVIKREMKPKISMPQMTARSIFQKSFICCYV